MNTSKTIFISGIFNVLHPGHIRLFRFADELGGKICVGLLKRHDDQSNILNDEDRLMALQSISLLHEVSLIENVEEALCVIKPDIVVKGHEFSQQHNVEKDIISKWGGKLLFNSGESQSGSQHYLPNGLKTFFPQYPDTYLKFCERHQIEPVKLFQFINSAQFLRVAVIGDIIVDEYVDCDAVGLSREDPTIVVKPSSSSSFVGGAAIVAMHAKAFGCEVDFHSVSGDDNNGLWVKRQLSEFGVQSHILTDESRPTTTKRRYRSQQKTLLRVNDYRSHSLESNLKEEFIETFSKSVADYDIVIFSDFNYGLLNKGMVHRLQEIARASNVFMAADSQTSSQRGDLSKFSQLDLVSPTEIEARLATGIMDNNVGLAKVIEDVAEKLNVENVLITLGADGALILSANDKANPKLDSLSALNKNPFDVSGAGDLTLVCVSLMLRAGADLWQSSLVAMLASAIHVSKVGNSPIDLQQLKEFLEHF